MKDCGWENEKDMVTREMKIKKEQLKNVIIDMYISMRSFFLFKLDHSTTMIQVHRIATAIFWRQDFFDVK